MTNTQSTTRARVDNATSDLFFNHDMSRAILKDKDGNWDGYDDAIFLEVADEFANLVAAIGGPMYTAQELVDDFKSRV